MPVADPYQLGFSPDGKWLTVTGLARNQVDVYDAATTAAGQALPARSMPSHLAYSPDSSVVYVSLQGTGRLAAIDLAAWLGAVERRGRQHAGRRDVARRQRCWSPIMGTDYVAVVDPADGHVERRVLTGRGAHQIFLPPGRQDDLCQQPRRRHDVALDATTLDDRAPTRSRGGPDCIDFAPDGKLWITQRFAQKVAVLDPASGDVCRRSRRPLAAWHLPNAHDDDRPHSITQR